MRYAFGPGKVVAGDRDDLDEEDKRENQFSLEQGVRLFSVSHAENGMKLWMITEADRDHGVLPRAPLIRAASSVSAPTGEVQNTKGDGIATGFLLLRPLPPRTSEP